MTTARISQTTASSEPWMKSGPLLSCPWCGETLTDQIHNRQISHLIECGDAANAEMHAARTDIDKLAEHAKALKFRLDEAEDAIRWLYLLCQHYEQGVVATTGDPRADGKIVVYGKDITSAVRRATGRKP